MFVIFGTRYDYNFQNEWIAEMIQTLWYYEYITFLIQTLQYYEYITFLDTMEQFQNASDL